MKKIKIEPLKTILTISVGFILIFLVTKLKWTLLVAFIVGLIGIFSPYLSKKVNYLWMKLTYLLSLIIPNVLLGIIFFLFLFPISLLSKLFGKKDPLLLKNNHKSSYTTTDKTFNKKGLENPW
jgi:hypothetical protein